MPRPRDLPMPVRDHPNHENLLDKWKANAAPGPGTYQVTDPRESKLTTFYKGKRFPRGALYPGDFRTTQERDNVLDVPGPIYDPKVKGSGRSVSMTAASRFTGDAKTVAPGPGEYDYREKWTDGKSFTKASRTMLRFPEHAPSCTTYDPKLPKRHVTGGKFAKDSSSHFKSADRDRVRYDDPPWMSLEAVDRATNYVKLPFRSCTFGTAKRFVGRRAQVMDVVGPGAYDISTADKHRWTPVGKEISFGTARKTSTRNETANVGFAELPSHEVDSSKLHAPSVGFTKAKFDRGIPNPADTTIPSAKYSPQDLSQKGKIQTTFATSERRPLAEDTGGPGPAHEGISIPTTMGTTGPQISFTKATRGTTSIREVMATAPGPGTYTSKLSRRPESAGGHKFGKELRPDVRVQSGASTEGVPGPKYNPDIAPTRPKSASNVYIHRSSRSVGAEHRRSGIGGYYSPSYKMTQKNTRGAILYLTG